jgi:hypothetical protein
MTNDGEAIGFSYNWNEVKFAAETAYEANRLMGKAMGDNSLPIWEDAPTERKNSFLSATLDVFKDPKVTPAESHAHWVAYMAEGGWTYGPVRDAGKKEHPSMVPYNRLPAQQRATDELFQLIVRTVLDASPTEAWNRNRPSRRI